MLKRYLGGLAVAATLATVLIAQTKTSPPPPSGTLISKELCGDGIDNDGDGLIDEGCSTSGGTTKGGSTLPAAVPIQSSELLAKMRGNEGTEYLQGATTTTISKAMPNATISGVDDLFHVALPTTTLVSRGLNLEHIIAAHDTANDFFTPRLPHMPAEALDSRTVRMCQFDPAWGAHTCLTYTAVDPHAIDLTVSVVFDSAEPFAPQGSATLMFASYMPYTTDPALYLMAVSSPGAVPTFTRWLPPYPGGSMLAVNASALAVDPAPAQTWGYATDYKHNLASVAAPRYAEPWYVGVQTATNTAWQMSFDPGNGEIALTTFEWKEKQDTAGNWNGDPAWDWQFRIPNVVAGQEYHHTARLSVYPISEDLQVEGQAEYAAFVASH